MMLKRCMLLVLLLACGFFATGCAGVIEFNTPTRFEHQKHIEDPPEGWVAPGPSGTRLC
jgi:hypothetical protein